MDPPPEAIAADVHVNRLLSARRAQRNRRSRNWTDDGSSGILNLNESCNQQPPSLHITAGCGKENIHTGPCPPIRLVVIAQP